MPARCGAAAATARSTGPRVLARFGAALVLAMAVGAVLTTAGMTAIDGGTDHTFEGMLWFGRNLCSALSWSRSACCWASG